MVKTSLIIYEDKDFIAVNKPAGLLVHRTINSKERTLVDWLVEKYPEIKMAGDNLIERPGIVHRLDKDTSGILLIARNQNFFEYLKNLFQKHEVKKTYLALIHGELKSKKGIIEKPISLKSGTTKRTVQKGKLAKEALTEYKIIKHFNDYSLVQLIPKTGRTHQLRVHLASIGHPIVGDQLYGRRENPWGLKRQFLHAQALEFSLSDRSRIKIESDLPEELKRILIDLEK